MTGSTQMHNFAQSLIDYAEGREATHYPGEFTQRLSAELAGVVPTSWGIEQWKVYATSRVICAQKDDLSVFQVGFDTWFPESVLTCDGSTASIALQLLRLNGSHGIVFQESPITGNPICINCATELEYWSKETTGVCKPCPLCTTKHPEFIGKELL